jgi:hypothetical protein
MSKEAKPKAKKHWQHVMLGTRCSWLHGDRRGFRDRNHRKHSTGDYKNPPPAAEHADLRRYYAERSGEPVDFDLDVRVIICREFVRKLQSLGFRVIACSVGRRHLHVVVELVSDYRERRRDIGKCKQRASHAVRALLPGSVWSEGGEFKRVNGPAHLRNVYEYIRTKQEAGVVVWSHRADEDWIADEAVGIVLMRANRERTRAFGVPQAPASEQPRTPPE